MIRKKIIKYLLCFLLYLAAIIGLVPFKLVNKSRYIIKWSRIRAFYTVLLIIICSAPQYFYATIYYQHVRPQVLNNISKTTSVKILSTVQYFDKSVTMIFGLMVYLYKAHDMEQFVNDSFRLKKEIQNFLQVNDDKILEKICRMSTWSTLIYVIISTGTYIFMLENYDWRLIITIFGISLPSFCSIMFENLIIANIYAIVCCFELLNERLQKEIKNYNQKQVKYLNDVCVLSDLIDKFADTHAKLIKLSNFLIRLMGFHCLLIVFNNFIPLLSQVRVVS